MQETRRWDEAETQEPTYSPADVCRYFDIPRSTLFRWEDKEEIPKAERGRRGERIYRQEQLIRIFEVFKERIKEEIDIVVRHESPDVCPPAGIMERYYLGEFFAGESPQHTLKMLMCLGEEGYELSNRTLRILAEEALNRPRRDSIRECIWELLLHYDRTQTQADEP